MIQELLALLPRTLTPVQTAIAAACALAGAFLWLLGARWSRAIVTLIAVSLGAVVGEMLPRWYLLPFNSMALAVLGAVLLGVFAALVPRIWVGMTLGIALSAWVAFGMWILLRGNAVWQTRTQLDLALMTLPEYLQDFWQRLPDPVRTVTPYAVATSMISGLAITLLWARIGRLAMCSCLGMTIMLPTLLTLISIRRPEWLRYIPPDPGPQLILLVGLVALGALIQWQILPARREAEPEAMRGAKEQVQDEPIGRYSWRG